jgi:mono/diheme cytochrome c family protein
MLRHKLILSFLSVGVLTGCNINMDEQPKVKALESSTFFKDGRGSRTLVEDTMPRGGLKPNTVLFTGKSGSQFSNQFPVPVTEDMLKRGQERYNIFCSVCHDKTGSGNGMIVQRGFKRPTSFHDERLRNSPAGYFVNVMTNGFGVMFPYNDKLSVQDRWAVAAYIRALQKSQRVSVNELNAEDRQKLSESQP